MAWQGGHLPVMPQQVLDVLQPAGRSLLVDCTVGAGGHSELLLQAAGPQARLIGLDVDEANLLTARQRLEPYANRVRLFQANFSQLTEVLSQAGEASADAVLADLGVASTQLDDPSRGLSFQADGPLDMRLDRRLERTAADLVNRLGEAELADLIYQYGQERYSRRIARAIVQARRVRPLERTGELEEVIFRAVPAAARAARRGVHPATRTFQALRIAVNDELGSLEALLSALPKVLAVEGRAAIISFHSLEDRRVKQAFADWSNSGQAELLTRKGLVADEREVSANARSRSARLRGIRRIA